MVMDFLTHCAIGMVTLPQTLSEAFDQIAFFEDGMGKRLTNGRSDMNERLGAGITVKPTAP